MSTLFRAKHINSNQMVIGTGTTNFLNMKQYDQFKGSGRTWLWSNYSWIEVDPDTLSVHHEGMDDSNGKPIFASLDKVNHIGGDILIPIKQTTSNEPIVCFIENGLWNYTDSDWMISGIHGINNTPCEYCNIVEYTGKLFELSSVIDGKDQNIEVCLQSNVDEETVGLSIDGTHYEAFIDINFCPKCGKSL